MDREHMLNDYVNENEETEVISSEALDYFDNLKLRLNGTKNLYQVMMEVSKFLDNNDLPKEIHDDIVKICNEFSESTDVYTARTKLEEYLGNYSAKKEEEHKKTDDELTDVKNEMLDKMEKRLDEVGINLTGDREEIIDSIEDEDDVDRIENNIENTIDYYMNRDLEEEDKTVAEVKYDTIDDVVESSDQNIILDEAIKDEMSIHDSISNAVKENEDGTISINADIDREGSINFAAMMMIMLATDDEELGIKSNLDMKLIKNKDDLDDYRVIFGNFPIANHPENRIDPVLASKINEKANMYDKTVDYTAQLKEVSPSLGVAFDMVNNQVMNREGSFQMALKNNGNTHDMVLGFDENYTNLHEAFNTNGVDIGSNGNYDIVHIDNIESLDQLFVLANTNETLKELTNENQKKNNREYVKTLDTEVANANVSFLRVLAVANILMFIVLIVLLVLIVIK